jgi:hypothetical protein
MTEEGSAALDCADGLDLFCGIAFTCQFDRFQPLAFELRLVVKNVGKGLMGQPMLMARSEGHGTKIELSLDRGTELLIPALLG